MTQSQALSGQPSSPGSDATDVPWPLATWPGRFARAMLGGITLSILAAFIDVSWARQAIVDTQSPPGLLSLFVHDLGLIAPAAFVVASLGAVFALVAHPHHPISATRFVAWFCPNDDSTRLRRAFLAPVFFLISLAWLVAISHAARWVLSFVEPSRLAGATLVACVFVTSIAAGALALALMGGAEAILGRRMNLRVPPTSAIASCALGIACVALCVAWGIRTGTTGGEGGILGVFGIFKRPELDLRSPALLLLIATGAYLTPNLLRKVPAVLALVVALAPACLTVKSATGLDKSPKDSAGIERGAPLGKVSLKTLRGLSDRDRDGASAYFGGGDCNDRNSDINPMAADVPSNGIDEDCSGADLVLTQGARTNHAAQDPAASPADAGIPQDLNVILISVDTLRWDLGFAGNARPVSPTLDDLASRSTVFTYAYSLASYTGKSIGPMMVGKYPSETTRGWSHYNNYPKSDRMVQERLSEAGVRTLAIHAHWYFKGTSGLGRGFDVLDMSAVPAEGIGATSDTTTTGQRLTDAAVKVLGNPENTKSRFFAWIHYFDPHADYVLHKGTPDFGNGMRDRYDHEVRFVDDQIGRLFAFMREQSWGKNTAIIITSDHGEAFGEHGMIRHGFEVWDELVRVPLVVHVPGFKAKRVNARRSAVDLVPTILDLFHVKMGTPRDEFDFLSGTSLAADVISPEGKEPPERDVFIDMPAGPFNEERRAFIRDNLKLVIAGGVRFQLFDLKTDPAEKRDLSDDKDRLKASRDTYNAFRANLREVRVKPPPKTSTD